MGQDRQKWTLKGQEDTWAGFASSCGSDSHLLALATVGVADGKPVA